MIRKNSGVNKRNTKKANPAKKQVKSRFFGRPCFTNRISNVSL